ncbi:hypothetical protein SLA2020_140050 [Shorea laevis]
MNFCSSNKSEIAKTTLDNKSIIFTGPADIKDYIEDRYQLKKIVNEVLHKVGIDEMWYFKPKIFPMSKAAKVHKGLESREQLAAGLVLEDTCTAYGD